MDFNFWNIKSNHHNFINKDHSQEFWQWDLWNWWGSDIGIENNQPYDRGELFWWHWNPFPKVTSNVLANVIEYCTKHVDAESSKAYLKFWDIEFDKVDQGTLFDLINAANHLNIHANWWSMLTLMQNKLEPIDTKNINEKIHKLYQ
jgi:hypothetical protein